jgi:hypothetical protein
LTKVRQKLWTKTVFGCLTGQNACHVDEFHGGVSRFLGFVHTCEPLLTLIRHSNYRHIGLCLTASAKGVNLSCAAADGVEDAGLACGWEPYYSYFHCSFLMIGCRFFKMKNYSSSN